MTVSHLYEAHNQELFRYALRLTRDQGRAEDLVQETFIRAMTHLASLCQYSDGRRTAWLKRVLRNLFLDQRRTEKRQRQLMKEVTQQMDLVQSIWQSMHPMWQLLVEDALHRIPERDRDLLHQHYVLGRTSQEIANELRIPAATVRSRLHVALKKLRADRSRYL